MLKTLKLQNYRQHEDLTVDFTGGIQVIRGANEAGKSALIESISYALFGSRALRDSLDDTVTWGEDVKTLKVELTIEAGGQTLLFKRSKAGAEVIKDGKVFCTGQNEVSALAATLLGADVTTAQSLLMAPQGAIRGALEQGPKALSLLIEDLSSMEVFDQILEAAQTKLVLGSPAITEERLKGARATLSAATEGLPAKPDEASHAKALADLRTKSKVAEVALPGLETEAAKADEAWKAASALYLEGVRLASAVSAATTARDAARELAASLAAPAHRSFDMTAIDVLKGRLTWAEDHGKRLAAFTAFSKLPECDRQEGCTASELSDLIDAETKRLNDTVTSHTRTNAKITCLQMKRINHDKCDKCGQDVTHLEHVLKTNAEVDEGVAALKVLLLDIEFEVQRLQGVVAALDTIRRSADRFNAELGKLQGHAGYVDIDDSTYPPKVAWIGEIPPSEEPDLRFIRKQLQEAEANVKAIEASKTRYAMACEQLEAAEAALLDAQKKCAEFNAPPADEIVRLTEAKDSALLAAQVARGEVALLNQEAKDLAMAHTSAMSLWAASNARIEDAQKVIDNCLKDIEALAFNNSLIKRLRQIRPLIANKLWNTVLASVSVMFSQMRGEESWVTKEKKGFCVNGKAVESLSGSTLDILGLSIRCVLLRTFLPQCGLLVLDEPCAAADASRTEAMLGFLKSVDFQQTLLVSHEDVSESVADNLIQL